MDILDCCDICGEGHSTEFCPELGLNIAQTELDQLSTRARLTLPGYVQVVDNGSGLVGVVARETIGNKTQLGPFEAKRTTHIFDDTGFFTLKLIAKDGTSVCLDTTDENECNWLCLVRAATSEDNKNCMAYQLGNNIFYNTTRDIMPDEELLVWYAPHFARKQGKPSEPDGETRVLLGHRIEPLTNDLMLDTNTEPPSLYQTEDIEENTAQSPVDIVQFTQSPDSDKPTGEIRKAYYCPRCGNTFESQTRMVQHLREHVITGDDTPRRGRGRPKKCGNSDHEITRGRGRPRKTPVIENGEELSFRKSEKTYSRKRKLESDDSELDYDNNYEDGDDEDDFADKMDEEDLIEANGDTEYSPDVEISVSITRVQPRRSTRGKHSKFDKDYVYGMVKKEVKREVSDSCSVKPGQVEAGTETVNERNGVGYHSVAKNKTTKKARGRPKKIKNAVKTECNKTKVEPFGTLSEETIKESLMALKENDKAENEKEGNTVIECNRDLSGYGDIPKNENTENEVLNREQMPDRNEVSGSTETVENYEIKVTDKVNEFEVIGEANAITNKRDESSDENSTVNEKEEEAREEVGNKESEKQEEAREEISNQENEKQEEAREEISNQENEKQEEAREEISNQENEKQEEAGEEISNQENEKQEEAREEISNKENEKQEEAGDEICIKEGTVIEQNETEEAKKPHSNDLVQKEDKGSVVVMFEETEDGSYGCAICDDKFTNELDAISHFMNHDTKGTSTCKTCLENFQNFEDLLEHRKSCNGKAAKDSQEESTVDQENVLSHICDICKQAFKTAQYLYRHMVIHTDVFQCDKCGKTFSRKDSLQKHVLKCCPELAEKYKIFYCEVCLRVFSKESGKKRHVEKCKSVQCHECLRIYTSQHELSIHKCKSFDMDDSAKYSCGRCSKAFQSLYYLKQHQELHDSHIACDRCGKIFASTEELDSHKGLCTTLEGIRLYGSGKCNVCFGIFSNSKVFRNHFLSHTHPYQCGKCEKRFLRVGSLNNHDCEIIVDAVCNICNKTFKNQTNLEKHIKENGCMKYQCTACSEQFRSKAMSKNHHCIVNATEDAHAEIISISNTREVCPTCGKSFSTKSNLTKHMLLHGEKKFQCPHCSKFFHLDVYLKEHITCVHYKIFKYQCNVCGRLLKSKTGLIAHTRIFHAKNTEVYPCTHCGKHFKQKGNLRAHMYSHSKVRSFKCDICIKAFKYPDQLSRHKLEHKLTPKLKCIHCGKEFVKTYDLKKHLQVYHSGYIYVCGICSARCGHRHTLVRHYKRKHPESVFLTTQEGYLDGLLKHYSQLYDSSEQMDSVATKCIVLGDKLGDTDDVLQGEDDDMSQILSQDAAEALHSLALGHVSTKQFEILKDKGLFLQTEGNLMQNQAGSLIQDQGQVIIPQDSYLFEGQSVEEPSGLEDNAAAVTASSIDSTVGMIHNADGTVSINGIQGIPQTIEALNSADGQVVILQIVDPEAHGQQGDILQFNPSQQGEIIQLTEEQQEKLIQLNPNQQGQVIQLSADPQGEVISLNEDVYEAGGVYQGTELEQSSEIQSVIVDDKASSESIDQELENEAAEASISQTFAMTESDMAQNEAVKLDSIPVISLEGGDPNIQAPMVYSQDVTCSDEIV